MSNDIDVSNPNQSLTLWAGALEKLTEQIHNLVKFQEAILRENQSINESISNLNNKLSDINKRVAEDFPKTISSAASENREATTEIINRSINDNQRASDRAASERAQITEKISNVQRQMDLGTHQSEMRDIKLENIIVQLKYVFGTMIVAIIGAFASLVELFLKIK
jgi:chromosome segregation ATPase